MEQLQKMRLLKRIEITENTHLITFKRSFDFKPGQIIGITDNPKKPPRLYSICSAPTQNEISILFHVKTDGELTPVLATLQSGDRIWITPVQGKFTYNNEPAWWIATGTGIAPFYSMFLSGQHPKKLIQGGRTKNELFFRSTFEKLPDYVKCCSRDSGSGIFDGRLTLYLEQFIHLPKNINYYLCGNAEMVVDVRNLLIKKDVPFKNIITEIYF